MKSDPQMRAFTMTEGTPTVTFVSEQVQRMLPYHSFVRGRFEGGRITLHFGDLLVIVDGESLEELWEGLQLQDVRIVRSLGAASTEAGECSIKRIAIRNAAESGVP